MMQLNWEFDKPMGQYVSSLPTRLANVFESRIGTQRAWVGRLYRSRTYKTPAESAIAGA